ncbi:MAG: hypothetical protein ACLPX9_18955 [Rhodomicrobium sp.]
MSLSQTGTMIGESAAYGGFVDAAGGIVTMVLAIVGLSHTAPEMMVSIATIVFGAALLIQGGAMLSEYAEIMPGLSPTSAQFGGSSLSAVFLAGAGGIVLGILALLGINPPMLTSAAIVAFGAALMLSSNSVWLLYSARRASLTSLQQPPVSAQRPAAEMLANEMASGSATMQALAGLTAIVLGIIALAGGNATVLSLVALLALGGALILTGSTLSATVMGFMRPAGGEHPARSQP